MTIKRRAMSPTQKEERRQAILDAALQLFEQTAYQEISMAQVAQKVGVAKGTVYLYFKTKEELFLALQTQQFEAWFEAVDAELQAKTQPCTITEFVTLMGDTLAARPALTRLIAILHTILERNIDLATARQFKQMLKERVLHTGPLLEACLPFLNPGQGAQLLLRIHALVIGFQHVARPAPVVQQALQEPGLEIFTVEFTDEFLATLKALLTGLKQETRSQ